MLNIEEISQHIYQRGLRRLYYRSKKLKTGKEVSVIIYSPELDYSTYMFTELGYGVYYCDYDFCDLGNYVVIYFENGVQTGIGIYRISL